MSMMISEFKPGRSLLLASTGLTSTVALLAGAQAVQAEGLYGGLSYGMFSGEAPNETQSYYPDYYDLTGGAFGVFVGAKIMDLGSNLTLGAELAFSSQVEADQDNGANWNKAAYDIDWIGDVKLRLGTTLGQVNLYGFAGGTIGQGNSTWTSYGFQGTNFGLGAETNIGDNMFIGIEAIQRNVVSPYVSSWNPVGDDSSTKHQAISLRAGFRF